jgi:hypothetical protein
MKLVFSTLPPLTLLKNSPTRLAPSTTVRAPSPFKSLLTNWYALVLGGRTYPLAGAAMMFPMNAPYTDPVTIIMCGGSTEGAGQALDNCVSVQPEVENPVWTIERMVG